MATELPSKDSIAKGVEAVEAAISALEQQVLELTYVGNRKEVDPEALAAVVAGVKNAADSLSLMKSEASKALSTVVSSGAMVQAGDVYLERSDSKPRKKWQHDKAKAVVIEKVLARHTDDDTGTIDAPTSVILQEAFSYAGISYWKVGQLKEIGINADDFCDKGEPKTTFNVVTSTTTNTKDEEDDFLD